MRKNQIRWVLHGLFGVALLVSLAPAEAQERGADPYGTPTVAAPAGADGSTARDRRMNRIVQDLTRGVRIDGPHVSIAQSKSNPDVLYMGTLYGRVYVSTDAGLSWEESSILTQRGRFFGSIRPAGDISGILNRWVSPSPISVSRVGGVKLESSGEAVMPGDGSEVGTRTGGDLDAGDPLVGELTGIESARRASASSEVKSMYSSLIQPVDGGGGGGGGGGTSSLAIGLRARAPWLAYQVRRKRRWGIGISLQQNLVLKASAGTGIWHLEVHPTRPTDILAATDDGLRRSRDGGYSWPLILTGVSQSERQMNHVIRSPFDERIIYASSKRGLLVSNYDGETFQKMLNRRVASADIRWVALDRTRRDVMYAGATYGLLRSADRGRTFKLVHRSPWPALSKTRHVAIDPVDPSQVWLGTADGLLVSRDDGQTFDRAGGLLFIGQDIRRIAFGSEPGHVLVGTIRDLWESYDGGRTWQVAYFGPIQWDVRNLISDARAPGSFLIATTGEVLRFGPGERSVVNPQDVRKYRDRLASEPNADDAVIAALERSGVYRPDLMAYRNGARFRGLMPQLEAAVRWADFSGDRALVNSQYDSEPIRLRSGNSIPFMISGTARWNLESLIYSSRESIARRIGRTNRWAEYVVTRTVISLHQERSRLLFEAMTDPGPARTRLMRDLRLEELTAHLNQLTGNLFEPYAAL